MKLFVIAGLITFCSAGSLEHLEHQQSRYLPPGKGSVNSPSGNYGVSANDHGEDGENPIGIGGHASIKGSNPDFSSDKEPSASENNPEFAGYVYGPGIKNIYSQQPNQKKDNKFDDKIRNQHFGHTEDNFDQRNHNQLHTPQGSNKQFGQQTKAQENHYQAASQFGDDEPTALGTNSIGARYYPKPSSTNNDEHHAPHSSQNAPQQAFDEETGYHY